MTRIPMTAPLIAVLVLTALAHEADAGAKRSRPVRTGQTTCWNTAGDVIDCAGTGQDGELRRGEPRAYLDLGDGTIRDQRTALMWEKQSDDGTIHDKDNTYTWEQAFEKIDTLNTTPCFAGFCDWRLPNRFELESILDLNVVGLFLGGTVPPAFKIDCVTGCTGLDCSCTGAGSTWTSTSFRGAGQYAWVVGFATGNAVEVLKTGPRFVRAVRGGS